MRGARETKPHEATPTLGRLRWRCRRGMQELDVLLARYVDRRFASASFEEQEAFQRLLETEDTVIYGYCLGQERPPDHLAALIEQITANASADR
jgi:antitoxin CptB